MTNGMDARTTRCLYLEPKMNGTNTHSFMRLDDKAIISVNHHTVLPNPDIVSGIRKGRTGQDRRRQRNVPDLRV